MSDIQEQIKIAHRKALEQDFNEIIKELKQEEHKNLELSIRINKAIEAINFYQSSKTLAINYDNIKRIRGILKGNDYDLYMFEEELNKLQGKDK